MRSDDMNAVAIRTAGKYLGAWGAIVCFVVLLSCLFTFLGTITCAVLVGMMMGAFKGEKWFSVSISLVFPAVIVGMVRGARVELTQQQVILLAALCFGTFWVTYLVSAVVLFCEQREAKSSTSFALTAQERSAPRGAAVVAIDDASAIKPLDSAATARESGLEQLQGNWVRDASTAGAALCKKVIQIRESKLELRAIDNSGHVTLLASGEVTLQSLRSS
jgi:hypothetical protein